jgi:hypothetical protein
MHLRNQCQNFVQVFHVKHLARSLKKAFKPGYVSRETFLYFVGLGGGVAPHNNGEVFHVKHSQRYRLIVR